MKFTIPPARSTTDIIVFWIRAKTDSTLWKRVPKMERMVEIMEERREERESVRPAIVEGWLVGGRVVRGGKVMGILCWMRRCDFKLDLR